MQKRKSSMKVTGNKSANGTRAAAAKKENSKDKPVD